MEVELTWQVCGVQRQRPECDIPRRSVRKYVTASREVRNVETTTKEVTLGQTTTQRGPSFI